MTQRGGGGRRALAGVALLMPALLGGCADLASDGPRAEAVVGQAGAALPYRLVPITPATLAVVTEAEPDRLAGAFPATPAPAPVRLGIGDVLAITVYEAAPGGLFVPGEAGSQSANDVRLPDQTIDPAGTISFPFGGRIRAAGLTTRALQDRIMARIRDRAIDPQVIVTVVSQQTNLVSVEGAVRAPVRYPAAAPGARDRVSDALTRAGGLAAAGDESWVTLTRDGRSATVPFEALLARPAEDVFVLPGDRLLVTREPQRFVAFGALGPRALPRPDPAAGPVGVTALPDGGGRAEIPFGAWRLSLAAALAKAGGLLDTRADPAAVFLYRREPAPVAARLGVGEGPLAAVPVVFRLDLSDPAGFLLATRFPMRNGDLLYVADARGAEISKALDYFGSYLSTAVSAGTAAVIGRSALSGSGTTGLPTIGGLAVVPSGVTGLPGTVTPSGLVNGVSAAGGTATPTGGTVGSGATNGTTRDAATMAPLLAPRATMTSPASR